MKRINYISLLLLIFVSTVSFGQLQLGRQVIGSTGSYATGTSISLSSTVGEPMVQTLFSVNYILTQGFQQTMRPNDSIVAYEVIDESCPGANNGSIFIEGVLGCPPGPNGYTIVVKSVLDTTKQIPPIGLATGDYEVVIIGQNGCVYFLIIHVGLESDEDCELIFYSGITPNGDGRNDSWIIENIEMFPENTVQIFNRWGQEVWFGANYDNVDVVWNGNNGNKDDGDQLANATYFFVAIVNGETHKGWVELTR